MPKYITFALSLFVTANLIAQSNDSITKIAERFHLEGKLGLGWGSGNLQRNFNDKTIAFDGAIGYKLLKDRFLYLQLIAGWNRLERFQTKYLVQFGNEYIDVNHSATSALFDIKLGLKYEAPQIYYIIPFMRFSIGTRNAYLYSEIKDDFNDEVIESYRPSDDWSYLYSISAGFQVPVTNVIHVHLSGSYSGTGSMNIQLPDRTGALPGSTDPVLFFREHLSSVELYHIHLGISMYVNN